MNKLTILETMNVDVRGAGVALPIENPSVFRRQHSSSIRRDILLCTELRKNVFKLY